MSRQVPYQPKSGFDHPPLEEPYESLVRWQTAAQPGSQGAEQAKARLYALLARDLTKALIATNRILTWIAAALGFIGVLQLLQLLRK